MSTLPKCPQCGSEYTYVDGNMYVCPECAHEWSADAPAEAAEAKRVVKDAFGTLLQEGGRGTGSKERKIKGPTTVVRVGTMGRNIGRAEGDHASDGKRDRAYARA